MSSEVSLSTWQADAYPRVAEMVKRFKAFEQAQAQAMGEDGQQFFSALRTELGIIRKAIGTKMLYALVMGNAFGGNYELWALQQRETQAQAHALKQAGENQKLMNELKSLRAQVAKLKK